MRTNLLRPIDFAILVACCAVIFAFPVCFNRTLSTHETVHCQNVREMYADGDLIIPHYGDRPWLERPPLPFWLTLPLLATLGDHAATFRIASALPALLCVLLVGWMASLWYGRGVGMLSALALATMRQFNHYSTGTEADIFVCAIVTAGLALFVYLEFRLDRSERETWFLGARPYALLAFFAVLGLGNLVKGLFFADAFILLPIGVFLLWGDRPLSLIRRYVWLPGWLVFAAIGSAWAIAAYLRHPDIIDLWFSDYAGRMNSHYMREPAWYYFLHLPLNLFPWTPLAIVGLWLTWRQALTQGRTPERFLWCWAIVPLVAFSFPSGKHQHYLLHAVAPWSILAAVGAMRLTQTLAQSRTQLAATCAIVFAALTCWAMHVQPRFFHDRYAADVAFVQQVRKEATAELLVLDDWGPLDASWSLFYLKRARLLHNATFLLDDRMPSEVFVVTRRHAAASLHAVGRCECLFESEHSRAEPSPDYRLGLYRVQLTAQRHPSNVYISPMQATGRAPGPYLGNHSSSGSLLSAVSGK